MVIEVLTAILAFITAIYVYLTHRMAKASEVSAEAMRAQSEAALRPYVMVTIFVRPHTPILYLRISNTGKTGADRLRLVIDKDFYQFGENSNPERNLRGLSAFNTPIDSLAPNSELIFALGQGWVLFGKDAKAEVSPVQFSITATYSYFGKTVEETSNVDLRPYVGTEGERDPVVEELERIRKVLEQKK